MSILKEPKCYFLPLEGNIARIASLVLINDCSKENHEQKLARNLNVLLWVLLPCVNGGDWAHPSTENCLHFTLVQISPDLGSRYSGTYPHFKRICRLNKSLVNIPM